MSAVIRYTPSSHVFGISVCGPGVCSPSLLDQFFGSGFDRLFDAEKTAKAETDTPAARWTPAADIHETADAVLLDLEIPGVAKDDIDVSVEDGVLKVSGERTFKRDVEKETYQRVERFYGKFSRSFRLPRHIDTGKVKASFKDGVLSLELPKAAEARPRQIAIH
jgi:HSP20 family protein